MHTVIMHTVIMRGVRRTAVIADAITRRGTGEERARRVIASRATATVSYTHLTLPTIAKG